MQIYVALAVALVLALRPDPTPGLLHSREEARRYACERVTPEELQRTHPGRLRPPRPRGDYTEHDAVVCTERLLRPGLRDPGDEAVLSSLDARAAEIASLAAALRPDLRARTWLVEVFHPDPQVSAKVAFAAKNALMAEGLAASDRRVALAVGDVDVLTRMEPFRAYPTACARYAQGSLGAGDALLAVIQLDPRETALHAGVCDRGTWSWLR